MNLTRRSLLGVLGGGIASPMLASWPTRRVAAQGAGTVTIASWGGRFQDAQRKAFFEPFQKATGIRVVEATGPNIAKIRAMVTSGNTEWDVAEVVPADLLVLAENNLLEKLDYKMIDSKVVGEIDQRVVHPKGVGTILYSQVIAFNTRKYPTGKHPKSWTEVWDAARFPGPRVLPAGNYVVRPNEFALMADGVQPDKLYPLDLERSYRSLSKIRPHVVKWATSGTMAPQALVDGEADIAIASHGRIVQLNSEGAPVDFDWNQALIQADYWAIPKGAKNYKNAMKFIEFASQAEPLANLCKQLPYGPVNKRSFDFMTAEEAKRSASHPANLDKQIFLDAEWWARKDAAGKSNVEKNLEMWNSWIAK